MPKHKASWRNSVAVFLDRLKFCLVGKPTPDEMERPIGAVHTLQFLFEFGKGSTQDIESEVNRALNDSDSVLGVDIKHWGSGTVSGELLSGRHKKGEVFLLAFSHKQKLRHPIVLKGIPQVKILTHTSLGELNNLVNTFSADHAVTSANLGFVQHSMTNEPGVWWVQINYFV